VFPCSFIALAGRTSTDSFRRAELSPADASEEDFTADEFKTSSAMMNLKASS